MRLRATRCAWDAASLGGLPHHTTTSLRAKRSISLRWCMPLRPRLLLRATRSDAVRADGPLLRHHLVDGDRQVAHAPAGRVKHRIGDRRRGADDTDLAHALDAERVDQVVLLLDKDHV